MAASWATALLAVQKIDLRIRDLKTRLTMLPVERKKLIARHHELADALAAERGKINQLELDVKKRESAIEALQSANAKLQQQSALVKKNAEYQAMLAEVESNNAKISDIESTILADFDRLEAAKAELRTTMTEANAENRLLKTEFTEFEELEAEIKKEIALQLELRVGAAAKISENIMARYTHLLADRGEDTPLTAVENSCCGNCCLKLTPQTMTAARNGAVAHCDNCNHLIYIEDL